MTAILVLSNHQLTEYTQNSVTFVSRVLLLVLSCLVCNCCWLAVCIVVVVLCGCYLMCTCCTVCALLFFTLDAGLLVRSQYLEGPETATSTQFFFGFRVPKSKC